MATHVTSAGVFTHMSAQEGASETCEQLPLAFVQQGKTVQIVSIRGNDELHHHLENLGFVEGGKVRVIADQKGNLIVEVKGSRVALNRATANRIVTR